MYRLFDDNIAPYLTSNIIQYRIHHIFIIKQPVQKISALIESISKWANVEFEIEWTKWLWIDPKWVAALISWEEARWKCAKYVPNLSWCCLGQGRITVKSDVCNYSLESILINRQRDAMSCFIKQRQNKKHFNPYAPLNWVGVWVKGPLVACIVRKFCIVYLKNICTTYSRTKSVKADLLAKMLCEEIVHL